MTHWSKSRSAAPLYGENQSHVGWEDHSKQRIQLQGRGHFQVTVKERPGTDHRRATPKRKAAHCGSEAGDGLRNEELTPFGKDKHRELEQPMDDDAG